MIILILIIVIAVLAIRYFQVAKRTLNEDEFEKEVRRAAGQYRTASRIIHCDYCGGRINPARDRVCPSCGASYRTDSETCRGPDADAVRSDAEDYVRRKKEEVKANTAGINTPRLVGRSTTPDGSADRRDRKSTRLNSSHPTTSRMPSSA